MRCLSAPRCWLVVLALAAFGCQPSGLPEGARPTKPVTVKVTYKGAPVEGALITFVDTGDPPAPAFGKTDAQGVAKMKTYVEGDGAVVGTHQVAITKTETTGGAPTVDQDSPQYDPNAIDTPTTVKHLIPQKYESKVTSGLTAEVEDSGPNEFTFDLTD